MTGKQRTELGNDEGRVIETIEEGVYPMEDVLTVKEKEELRGKLKRQEPIMVYGSSNTGKTELLRWLVKNIDEDKKVVVLGLGSGIYEEYKGIGGNVKIIEYGGREDVEELVNKLEVDYVVYDELNTGNNLLKLKEGITVLAGYVSESSRGINRIVYMLSKYSGENLTGESLYNKINELYPTRLDIQGINREYIVNRETIEM